MVLLSAALSEVVSAWFSLSSRSRRVRETHRHDDPVWCVVRTLRTLLCCILQAVLAAPADLAMLRGWQYNCRPNLHTCRTDFLIHPGRNRNSVLRRTGMSALLGKNVTSFLGNRSRVSKLHCFAAPGLPGTPWTFSALCCGLVYSPLSTVARPGGPRGAGQMYVLFVLKFIFFLSRPRTSSRPRRSLARGRRSPPRQSARPNRGRDTGCCFPAIRVHC